MTKIRNLHSSIDHPPAIETLRTGDFRPDWIIGDPTGETICVATGARGGGVAELDFGINVPVEACVIESIRTVVIVSRLNVRGFPQTNDHLGQVKLLARYKSFVRWMASKEIYTLRSLTPFDLDEFIGLSRFGIAHVLCYKERFLSAANRLLIDLGSLPARTQEKSKFRRLDVTAICKFAGIDVGTFRKDPVCAFESQRLAYEHGFYLSRPIANFACNPTPPKPSLVTASSIRKMLMALEGLFELRRAYPFLDHLIVSPTEGLGPQRLSRRLAKVSGRTKSIPPSLGLKFLDRAIRWVVDYGPELLDLRDAVEPRFETLSRKFLDNYPSKIVGAELQMYKAKSSGPGAPWPVMGYRRNHFKLSSDFERPSMHVALNVFLPAACAVVIEAFTARREGEVLGLMAGCVSSDGNQIRFRGAQSAEMESYVEKTMQTVDSFPIVKIVVKAIEILERWSARAREISGTNHLFQYRDLSGESVHKWTTKDAIPAFARYVGADIDEAGNHWKYSDHQFRRMFAMLYFWRFEGASLTALSDHLRHFNLEMTRHYILEAVGGEVMQEIHQQKLADLLRRSFTGEVTISGGFGERINRLRDMYAARVRANMDIVSRERFIDMMVQHAEALAESGGYEIQFTQFGACFGASRNRQRFSKCVTSEERGTTPQPNNDLATSAICTKCPNFLLWADCRPSLEQALVNAKSILNSSKNVPPLIVNAVQQQANLISSQLRDFPI